MMMMMGPPFQLATPTEFQSERHREGEPCRLPCCRPCCFCLRRKRRLCQGNFQTGFGYRIENADIEIRNLRCMEISNVNCPQSPDIPQITKACMYQNLEIDQCWTSYRFFRYIVSNVRCPPSPDIPVFFMKLLNESFDVIKYRNRIDQIFVIGIISIMFFCLSVSYRFVFLFIGIVLDSISISISNTISQTLEI